jgi:hypothetical protein
MFASREPVKRIELSVEFRSEVMPIHGTAPSLEVVSALLAKQETGIGGVIADQPVVGHKGVAKTPARMAQNVISSVTAHSVAARIACSAPEDAFLTVADGKYFHVLPPY